MAWWSKLLSLVVCAAIHLPDGNKEVSLSWEAVVLDDAVCLQQTPLMKSVSSDVLCCFQHH